MTNKKRSSYLPVMLVIFLFYLFVAYCIPYCHDDWDWGIDVGLEQFFTASLNSRYAGNFFVIAMTRSEIVKTLVIAFTLFFIPLLISKLCDEQRSLSKYFAANVLMLVMPRLMWQQSVGWVSGFANYVIPAMLTLFLINIMKRSLYEWRSSFWLSLPLAAIAGLFIENLSVYGFLAFLIFTVLVAIKNKRLNAFHVFMTLFSLLGCVLVFSSAVYKTLLADGIALGGIRVLAVDLSVSIFNIASAAFGRFFTLIFPYVFYDYPIICASASLALIIAALRGEKCRLAVLVTILTAFLNIFVWLGIRSGVLIWIIPTVLFLCLIALVILSGRHLALQLFLLLSVPATLFPLVMTPELGPRLYLMPYIFLSALTVAAIPPLKDKHRLAETAAAAALLCCIAYYGYIYAEIRCVTVDRAEAIEEAIEKDSEKVFMRKDTYEYWWGRNPQNDSRIEFFKEFYGIPESMVVIFEK